MKFTYKVTINALSFDDDKKVVETMSGETRAEMHAQALQQVQSLVWERCKQLERERGGLFGYENVRVTVVQDVAATSLVPYADFMQAYRQGKALPASTHILVTVAEFAQHEQDLIEEVFERLRADTAALWSKREGKQ